MTTEEKYDEALAVCNQVKLALSNAKGIHTINSATAQNNLKLALKKALELVEEIQSLQKK
jgi:hypothetical protein